MLGAIYGDIVGSRFEPSNINKDELNEDFVLFHQNCRFTDDTLMTLAVAESLVLTRNNPLLYQDTLVRVMKKYGKEYPGAGWGRNFYKWLSSEHYYQQDSYGNGAAMRISPVGWVCDSLEDTIDLSRKTTKITHNHPEGIKGAEAVAVAIYLARNGSSMNDIKKKMIEYYPEIANLTYKTIRATYEMSENGEWITCQGGVPQAIVAFLESTSLEDAVRKAVMYGADTDTQAAIAGSIAEAYYGFTYAEEDKVLSYLNPKLQSAYQAFNLIKKKRIKRED